MSNQWQDPLYHTVEAMRELSAAELHLVQYITEKESNPELLSILEEIRTLRKSIETTTFGG